MDANALYAVFSNALEKIGYFEGTPTLAAAISGGPDSMALLLLAKRWAIENDGHVIVLTVNHGLRPEATDEAEWVAKQCASHGISHHTLTHNETLPKTGLQAYARQLRYKLLNEWCKTNHVMHLLTAHHADDTAETTLFRLGRGSGLKGLAGIAACSVRGDTRILRPLLGFKKNQLLEYLHAANQNYITDPSNNSMAYTRNFMRQHLTNEVITRTNVAARKLDKIRNILENKEAIYLANMVSVFPAGYATLNANMLRSAPPVTAQAVLSNVQETLSGSDQPMRSQQLTRLHNALTEKQPAARRSAGGCIFQYHQKSQQFYVFREAARMAPPKQLSLGEPHYWDQRFWVRCNTQKNAPKKLFIDTLGQDAASLPAGALPAFFTTLPASLKHTFLCIRALEEVVCVPHIDYTHPNYASLACKAQFKPRKPLAGALFFGMNNMHQ